MERNKQAQTEKKKRIERNKEVKKEVIILKAKCFLMSAVYFIIHIDFASVKVNYCTYLQKNVFQ